MPVSSASSPIAARRVLWVEGKDDSAVVQSLCRQHRLPQVFVVTERGGIPEILKGLPIEVRAPGLECYGIVVDANGDLDARWRTIRDLLMINGYPEVPKSPASEGIVIPAPVNRPRMGVWIMPDNGSSGMVEDFAARLIPADDRLWPRAAEAIEAIPPEDRRFTEVRHSKALIHTWLSWQEDPGSPMGQAITKGDLDAEAPLARRFVDWLRRLMIVEDATPAAQP